MHRRDVQSLTCSPTVNSSSLSTPLSNSTTQTFLFLFANQVGHLQESLLDSVGYMIFLSSPFNSSDTYLTEHGVEKHAELDGLSAKEVEQRVTELLNV